MTGNIFVLELRRAIVPAVATVVSVLAVLFIVEEVISGRSEMQRMDISQGINIFVISLTFLFALTSGATIFSRDLKEKQILLYGSLPTSRSKIWLAIVAANFSASVAALMIAILLRPSILLKSDLVTESQELLQLFTGLGIAFATWMVIYSVGACLGLLFTSALWTHLFGAVLSGFAFFELITLSGRVNARNNGIGSYSGTLDTSCWAFGLVLFVAICLYLSHRFFTRGELSLSRVKLRNGAFAAAAFAGWTLAIALYHLSPISSLHEDFTWRPAAISPGARYVAFEGHRRSHARSSEIRIVDTSTGSITARLRGSAQTPVGWIEEPKTLVYTEVRESALKRIFFNNVVTVAQLMGIAEPNEVEGFDFWRPRTRVVSVRPDSTGRVTTELGSGMILPTESPRPEHALIVNARWTAVVMRSGPRGRVLGIHGETGKVLNLIDDLLEGSAEIGPHGTGALVSFINFNVPSRSWLVEEAEATELTFKIPPYQQFPYGPFVLGNEAFITKEELAEQLHRKYDRPHSAALDRNPELGAFVNAYWVSNHVPYQFFYITPSRPNGAVDPDNTAGLVDLWTLDKEQSIWLPVTTGLTIRQFAHEHLKEGLTGRFHGEWSVSSSAGLAAYSQNEVDGRRFFIYDVGLGRNIDLGPAEENEDLISIKKVAGFHGRIITINERGTGWQSPQKIFTYVPGEGKAVSWPKAIVPSDLLYLDSTGRKVMDRPLRMVFPDGREQLLKPEGTSD
jgi:hypothetical protein